MPTPPPPLKLKPLTVGPIVGETTATRTRIWGRGDTNIIDNKPRRCFGVMRHRPAGGAWAKPTFFKMNPNFDMTGVAVAEKLTPAIGYEYEIGYFFSDAELEDAKADNLEWSETSKGSFTTGTDDPAAPRTLVVGSCRYLLKTWLGDFFDDRGDKVFRSILELAEKAPLHQVVMVGDQIYADDLNAVNPDKTVEQFYQRYRDAFTQQFVRTLMSRVPTYMTLDDHEIEDNWPAKATQKDFTTLFPVAMHAYQTYQLAHGPSIPIVKGRLEGTPKYLWYDYSDGCCEVFVTDSRTERMITGTKERQMLGDEQVAALKRWLKRDTGRVKLVVTSVPFFPDSTSEGTDKWAGFVEQRAEILEVVDQSPAPAVVFLSGDVHASMLARMTTASGKTVLSVVSSAFFWPYPHPSQKKFLKKGTVDGGKAGPCAYQLVAPVVSDDNFTRLAVTPSGITWEVFERKGDELQSATLTW